MKIPKTETSEFVEKELSVMEELLHDEFSKGNHFITREALRLLKSGGKRIRPVFTILFSMLGTQYNSKQAISIAAAIETMHMATLIHDDTIDNAATRRGVETTFMRHGTHTAVYTGDWMFIKSLQLLSQTKDETPVNNEIFNKLATAIESVCEGELDQYFGRGRIPEISKYYSRIKRKTGALFVASCISGAKIAGLTDKQIEAAAGFGENFGIAFQIQDDLIDVESSSDIAGKPVKNDLNEGIITLPILLACKKSNDFKAKVKTYLENPSPSLQSNIRDEAINLGCISMAKSECRKFITKCLSDIDQLPQVTAAEEIRKMVANVFSSIS
ncbi:MAG: polyprenyl synthetase family protein [Saccharofermentanales bacterium]